MAVARANWPRQSSERNLAPPRDRMALRNNSYQSDQGVRGTRAVAHPILQLTGLPAIARQAQHVAKSSITRCRTAAKSGRATRALPRHRPSQPPTSYGEKAGDPLRLCDANWPPSPLQSGRARGTPKSTRRRFIGVALPPCRARLYRGQLENHDAPFEYGQDLPRHRNLPGRTPGYAAR